MSRAGFGQKISKEVGPELRGGVDLCASALHPQLVEVPCLCTHSSIANCEHASSTDIFLKTFYAFIGRHECTPNLRLHAVSRIRLSQSRYIGTPNGLCGSCSCLSCRPRAIQLRFRGYGLAATHLVGNLQLLLGLYVRNPQFHLFLLLACACRRAMSYSIHKGARDALPDTRRNKCTSSSKSPLPLL